MNVSMSAQRVRGCLEADLPDRLRPADLAPDLVALLLAETGEVVVHRSADRQRHDRTDVLALDGEGPALGHLARPERGRERVGGRVAAAKAAQVDDVPAVPVADGRKVVGEDVGDGRQVGRRGQDRRVVGVVGGAEEQGGGGRRDGREVDGVPAVAHLRLGQHVGRLDLVPVHQRDDARSGRHRAAHRPAPRRACPRGRSHRRRPTRRGGRPSRRTGSPRGCGRRGDPRSPAGCRRSSVARS